MNGTKIVTLPYADDFCLISANKLQHQKVITDINSKIESMGMKMKPTKCRSFSISAGKPTNIPFKLGDFVIPSVADEEQKFLGKKTIFSGKQSEYLAEG